MRDVDTADKDSDKTHNDIAELVCVCVCACVCVCVRESITYMCVCECKREYYMCVCVCVCVCEGVKEGRKSQKSTGSRPHWCCRGHDPGDPGDPALMTGR